MSQNKPLRSLNVQLSNWFPVSWDVGRDEALCAIENEEIILSSLGLMIAATALSLSKDDNWVSRNEIIRIAIPGTKENKLAAAEALCSVRLWCEEEREGISGWRIGVDALLDGKRSRHQKAKRAAEARYGTLDKRVGDKVEIEPDENPF